MSQPCRVCRTDTLPFAEGRVLGHVDVDYHRCPSCGLVMAIDPTWLEEAYGSAIAQLDIGLLDRCQILANVTATVLRAERLRGGRFLDWAGGYGTLTRLMRDRGYDFTHTDPFADNIFAAGHDVPTLEGERFDLVTAFEVLEHLPDPVEALADIAGTTDRLLVTTQVLPDPAPRPGEWWYYTPESGQHITFYTADALQRIGRELGFDGAVTGGLVHYFHRGPVSRATRNLVARPAIAYGLGHLAAVVDRRHSLLQSDLARITG
jgi:hypothetical protein